MAFEIRPATGEDAPAIRRVARESWHAAYDDLLGEETVDSVVDNWYDLDRLAASITREDGRFLVAEVEGEGTGEREGERKGEKKSEREVVGFAQAALEERDSEKQDSEERDGGEGPHTAELTRLYVHPDCWGRGIGMALMERVEAWCRDHGAERLRLVVLADNEVGNAFYEKRGYRRVESRESEIAGETVTDLIRETDL